VGRRGVLLLVALTLLLASACQVRTNVAVEVKPNGSGTVNVTVGVDDDALQKAPELAHVRTDDLTAAGWTVTGPTKNPADGFTNWSASKPFANPEQATQILGEISGPNGPFKNFVVTRDRSFAKTDYGISGTIDLTGGLQSFSDSALAAQLDGKPLGDDIAAIEQRIGQPLDDVFKFQLFVRLPGSLTSNAPVQFGNTATWQPKLTDSAATSVQATSKSMRWPTVIGIVLIAVAIVGLFIWLGLHLSRRRKTNVGSFSGP
jgi:hypothetical protein